MSKRNALRGRSRRRVLVVSFLAGALSLVAAAAAEEPRPPGPEPKAEPAKPADELVCKRERVVGSNIPRRTCRKRAQIEAERQASQQAMGELPKTAGPNRE